MKQRPAKIKNGAMRWPAMVAASVAVSISLLLAILTFAGAGVEARVQVPGGAVAAVQAYGPGVPIEQRLFPSDNPWNTDISSYAIDPASARYLTRMGLDTGLHADFGTVWNGAPNGIPYMVVPGNQPRVPISFYYASESDPGPYPIPPDAPIEGGVQGTGDRHILILDPDNQKLYEVYDAHRVGMRWEAGSGAVFDLTSNALRPDGWTSADAAGLPMLAGLVRFDEVQSGLIDHALRFTISRTQRAYISPATHFASSYTDADLPPMGLRLRLKSSVDIAGFPKSVQVVLQALKTYGMIVADNGGDFYISGAPDPRWNDNELHQIGKILGRDFEVVDTRSAPTVTTTARPTTTTTVRPTTTTTARPTTTATTAPAPPRVAFLAPVDAAVVPQGKVSVKVQASAAKGVDRVQFYVDARSVATDRTAPYSFVWNAARVPVGPHVLSVRAFDRSGRVASASVQVRVSRTARTGMQQ